jgi:hypothetical protein
MNIRRVQKHKGIGNVITTLIILIASVVLGAGVIFFGGSMFQTNTQSESIKVSNTHTWVAANGTASVTAFAIQNTGSKAISVSSISYRGLPVANLNWFSCIPANCGTSQNINTDLSVDYTPASVTLASGATPFTSGPISLTQGQATVVYVTNAGNVQGIDAGNTYSLQVQAGQSQAVLQVQVISG